MAITITSPQLSPSLNTYGNATLTDENSNVLPVLAVVSINSDGESGVDSEILKAVSSSQVTGLVSPPLVQVPGGKQAPLYGLVSIDTSGNIIPFEATTATTATTAAKVTGKFQSAVRTGTGSQETIAHGLGVAPTMVLVSVYDTTETSTYTITEGTHTTTNLLVTVTADIQYKVVAFA